MSAAFSGWVVETLIASTLLMVLVLLIRGPVRRAFGPGMAYALWALPAARMVLPPLPDAWREVAKAPVAAAGDVIAVYLFEPISAGGEAVAEASSIDWLAVFATAWAVGAALFLLYHLVSHSLFCRRLLARAQTDRGVAHGKVRVIETDAAHGPLAFGIWRKYVAFPRDFSERYDDIEQDLALAHELGHHVRGDLIANWAALIVLAIHWFNPVAWRAFRAFRADQEMACDALVLSGRAQALRHAYGRAIVKSAHGGAVSAACHLHTINEIKGRLRMLSKNDRKSPTRIAAGTLGVSIIAVAALGITASGTQAAERIKAQVERTVGVNLSVQDVPPAPPAPVAPVAEVAPDAPEPPIAPEAPLAPISDDNVVVHVNQDRSAPGATRVAIRRTNQDGPYVVDVHSADPGKVQVRERRCGIGGPDADKVTVNRIEGHWQVIEICTDRIEAVAADAERQAGRAQVQAEYAQEAAARAQVHAERSRRVAIVSARQGLESARLSIETMQGLPEEDRAEALRDIDEAIVELQAEAGDD